MVTDDRGTGEVVSAGPSLESRDPGRRVRTYFQQR